ncbi:protein PAM68, chloroplastic-like [Salvia splendens]|nr:protein PAM68, chloroplastic-like [Salvia splendens]
MMTPPSPSQLTKIHVARRKEESSWDQNMGIHAYAPLSLPPSLTSPHIKILSPRIHLKPISATLNSPKGFGPASKKPKKPKKPNKKYESEDEDEDEREEGVIPEIVTNRMMSRMGLSVGIPLFIGLLFFPFFYYLKVGLKIDVPTWVPFIVSFVFFGTALLGISYGIVSASWDPLREGSLLGWNEAKKNWPVFWQSLRGGNK